METLDRQRSLALRQRAAAGANLARREELCLRGIGLRGELLRSA